MKSNNKRSCKRIVSAILLLTMLVSCVSGVSYNRKEAKAEGYGLSDPRWNGDVSTWDCIWFGNYWQEDTNGDGKADENDEKTPIKWRVLSVNGDDAFLMADKGLDCKKYNETNTDITWETCTLRTWLNETFYNNVFDAIEQVAIKTTKVINEDNIIYGTDGGSDTSDRIFLLSQNEVRNYKYGFDIKNDNSSNTRKSEATAYAEANNCWSNSSGICYWWLRSPGKVSAYASNVYYDGRGHESYTVVDLGTGVRPALHINLSSSVWQYAGTVSSDGSIHENSFEDELVKVKSIRKSDTIKYNSYGVTVNESLDADKIINKAVEYNKAVNDFMKYLN